jgi:hypothetical protein
MKDIGSVTISKELAMKYFPMAALIKVNTSTASLREWENMFGRMDSLMKVSGSMDWNTAQECGEVSREIAMSENGEWVRPKVMEFIYGLTEIGIKEILKPVLNMVKALKSLQMEIFIRANTLKENLMATVSITGQTVATLKEDFEMD